MPYVTREEFEEFKLQVLAESCDDRKRITVLEEFSKGLYNTLWLRFRNLRQELEDKVLSKVPRDLSQISEDNVLEVSH